MSDLRLIPALSTHKGMRRRSNQDAVNLRYPAQAEQISQYGALFVVADGVGGLEAGEKASRRAVDRLLELYFAEAAETPTEQRLKTAIRQVNREVHDMPEDAATTLVAAAIRGDQLTVAWVGDSMAFRISGDQIERLFAADVLDVGDDVSKQGQLTRAIGHRSAIEIDTVQRTVQTGDRILLCSDGLTRYLADERLKAIAQMDNVRSAVMRMINEANDKGGADNVSVALIRVGEPLDTAELEQHVARLNAFVAVSNEPMMVQPTMTKPATRFPDAPATAPGQQSQQAAYEPINTKPASQFPDAPVVPSSQAQRPISDPAAASRIPDAPASNAQNWLPLAVVGVIILIGVLLLVASVLTGNDANAIDPAPANTQAPTQAPDVQPTAADSANAEQTDPDALVVGAGVLLDASVITYQRVGGDVAAFATAPDERYTIEALYTDDAGAVWYRLTLTDPNSSAEGQTLSGWIAGTSLPAYRVLPAADASGGES
jgi:PPM family protein phosphatase